MDMSSGCFDNAGFGTTPTQVALIFLGSPTGYTHNTDESVNWRLKNPLGYGSWSGVNRDGLDDSCGVRI